jgi:hypothetical protein
MTRKHFIAIANIIREYREAHEVAPLENPVEMLTAYFAAFLQRENKHFNEKKFRDYINS